MFFGGLSIIISTYVKSFFTKVVLPDFVPPDTNKPNGCLNYMEYMMKMNTEAFRSTYLTYATQSIQLLYQQAFS